MSFSSTIPEQFRQNPKIQGRAFFLRSALPLLLLCPSHISEITLYEGVQKQLKEWQQEHGGAKIPSDTALKKEKAILSEKKDRLYEERKELRNSIKVLEESYELFTTESEKKHAKHLEQDRS